MSQTRKAKDHYFITGIQTKRRLGTRKNTRSSFRPRAQTLRSVSSFSKSHACAGNIGVSTVMSSHATHGHTHTHTIISPGPVLPYDYPASPSPPLLSAQPSPQHESSGRCDVRFLWWAASDRSRQSACL